ncbi:MAG TPA: YXWGXW repeat-containing protein [Gammaproteobacteria bacterium]|jgi:hypothetical protein
MKRLLTALIVALSLGGFAVFPAQVLADVSVSVNIGPPALPDYPQPEIPGPGYIWTPGYWAYGPDGYYWVPGTWVLPPQPGVLWTPGFWFFNAGVYQWHRGYWGPHVGYYGGVNYGYGYTGHGYHGGYWHGHDFYYNRSVNNVDVHNIHNTYVKEVTNEPREGQERPSFSGKGGVVDKPTNEEQGFEKEQHREPTAEQVQHRQAATSRPGQHYTSQNNRPEVAATRKPSGFTDNDAVRWNSTGKRYGNASHNARPAQRNHDKGHPPRR